MYSSGISISCPIFFPFLSFIILNLRGFQTSDLRIVALSADFFFFQPFKCVWQHFINICLHSLQNNWVTEGFVCGPGARRTAIKNLEENYTDYCETTLRNKWYKNDITKQFVSGDYCCLHVKKKNIEWNDMVFLVICKGKILRLIKRIQLARSKCHVKGKTK